MFTDHFDGKSTARRSLKWLHAAAADAYAKRDGCRRDGSVAHERMWAALAEKYSAEITRREQRAAA